MDQTRPTQSSPIPSLASRRAGIPRPLPASAVETQSPPDSASPTGSKKRLHSEYEDGDDGDSDPRKLPANKKACDQCRQQKLKCNVGQNEDGSAISCERCIKRNLYCAITDGFKRTAKRDEHAALQRRVASLEQENRRLQKQVELLSSHSRTNELEEENHQLQEHIRIMTSSSASHGGVAPFASPSIPPTSAYNANPVPPAYQMPHPPSSSTPATTSSPFSYNPSYTSNTAISLVGSPAGLSYAADIRSNEAAAIQAMQSLSQRDPSSNDRRAHALKSIGDVRLSTAEINDLFERYWTEFHPYLPLLDRTKDPDDYFKESQLLFWTIVFVASRRDEANSERMKELRLPVMQLIYTTTSQSSPNYNIVKGLCLICTWPPHTNSTSTDPTFELAGIMMAMAMRLGLHRPSHARDFAKTNLVVAPVEVEDRLRTWAACNIVAQSVSTGYGQPSLAHFDHILQSGGTSEADGLPLPFEFRARLAVESLVKRISTYLYSGPTDDNIWWEDQRHNLVLILDTELKKLSNDYADSLTHFDRIYLKAAYLHLHLSVFFASPASEDYVMGLRQLYIASTDFIDHTVSPSIFNAPNYVMQMLLAAGFTVLKLLGGFFAHYMDIKRSKSLLTSCVHSLRDISVASNDLPCRLAEVLAQLSKASPATKRISSSLSLSSSSTPNLDNARLELEAGIPPMVDDGLKLLVKYRRSMSVVYDSVWSWREAFQGKGTRGNLDEAVRRPTEPDSGIQTPIPSMGAPPHQGDDMDLFSGLVGLDVFGAFDQTFDPLMGLPDVM